MGYSDTVNGLRANDGLLILSSLKLTVLQFLKLPNWDQRELCNPGPAGCHKSVRSPPTSSSQPPMIHQRIRLRPNPGIRVHHFF